MEDALKKLDKLTQEEVGMAVAQNLRATHVVDERVRGVANTVVAIDNRVAGVDDRVSCVDARVAGVDEKVADVINGTQINLDSNPTKILNLNCSDGKEAKQVIDQVKRSSLLIVIYAVPAIYLARHSSKSIAGEHPQMALPTGSVDQP